MSVTRIRPRSGGARLLLLMSLPVYAGCYTFAPATLESVRPGVDLRARLNARGVETVNELTGASRTVVDGRLERLNGETIVLSVWRTDLVSSNFQPGRLDLPIRRDDILDLEEKRFSRLRTGGVVGGLAAGFYLLTRIVWGGVGGLLPGDGDGGGSI